MGETFPIHPTHPGSNPGDSTGMQLPFHTCQPKGTATVLFYHSLKGTSRTSINMGDLSCPVEKNGPVVSYMLVSLHRFIRKLSLLQKQQLLVQDKNGRSFQIQH